MVSLFLRFVRPRFLLPDDSRGKDQEGGYRQSGKIPFPSQVFLQQRVVHQRQASFLNNDKWLLSVTRLLSWEARPLVTWASTKPEWVLR